MRKRLPSERVTYDLGITNSGVVRLAPFGTAPMAVVDGTRAQDPLRGYHHCP
ncbi:MAG: hypothetical protein M3Y39_00490 [Chloroflexota bacterium]|nr:hypothetical protein [Chloroflexota bacterium]